MNEDRSHSSNRLPTAILSRRLSWLAVAVALALLATHAVTSGCDHDEVEHLHAAWMVSQGLVPYRDFLEQHHPALYYVLAPLARFFDGSPRTLVIAARFANLAILATVLAVFLALARRVLDDRTAVWPSVLLVGCFFFLRNSFEVRPDPWMCALCLVALWQWAGFLRDGRFWRSIIAGLCIGFAIVFLQKAIAFAGLLVVGTVLFALIARHPWRRLLGGGAVLAASSALPLLLLVLLVSRAGMWRDFTFWNYTFNRFYYFETKFPGPSALAVLGVQIAEQPLLWLGGAGGLWLILRRRRAVAEKPELVLSAAVVVGIIVSLSRSRWPFSHNLLVLQPPLALLATFALGSARLHRARSALGALALILVAKVGVLCFTYDENPGALQVQEHALALTGPSDPVAISPPYHPIFRRDSFFFWYVPGYNAQAYAECCRRYGCKHDNVERDDRSWLTQPPKLAYAPGGEPEYIPRDLDAHLSEFRSTSLPGLWTRSADALPVRNRVVAAGGAARP